MTSGITTRAGSAAASTPMGVGFPPYENWDFEETYNAGRRVFRGGGLWEALVENANKDPLLVTTSEWLPLIWGPAGQLKDKLSLLAATAAKAGFNIGYGGTRPPVRINGDVWDEPGPKLFVRLADADYEFLLGSASVANGMLIDAQSITDAVQRSFTGAGTLIPFDNTVPTIAEGSALLSIAFTPKATTNKLKIRAVAQICRLTAGFVAASLFDGSTCRAAGTGYVPIDFGQVSIPLETDWFTASAVTSRTLSLRVGQLNTAGTICTGGHSSGLTLGGTIISSLEIMERKA